MDYNKYKSGIDVLDHMLKEFRPYRATRRWPFVVFCDLLGISSHAAYVLFTHKFPSSVYTKSGKRRMFLYDLGVQLALPLIKTRKESADYKFLHKDVKFTIESTLTKHGDEILIKKKTNSKSKSHSDNSQPISSTPCVVDSLSFDYSEINRNLIVIPPLNDNNQGNPSPHVLNQNLVPPLDIFQSILAPSPQDNAQNIVDHPILDHPQNIGPPLDNSRNIVTPPPPDSTAQTLIAVPTATQNPNLKSKKLRCTFCPRSKDKKVRSHCSICESVVCNLHSKPLILCLNCEEKLSFD